MNRRNDTAASAARFGLLGCHACSLVSRAAHGGHDQRCPRCGADRQEPRPGQPGSYLCNSADHQQSASCARREELRGSENLLTDAWSILAKFRFAPVTELRVVE